MCLLDIRVSLLDRCRAYFVPGFVEQGVHVFHRAALALGERKIDPHKPNNHEAGEQGERTITVHVLDHIREGARDAEVEQVLVGEGDGDNGSTSASWADFGGGERKGRRPTKTVT